MSLAVFHYVLWVEEPGTVTVGGVLTTRTMVFSWEEKEWLDKKQFPPTFLQEAVEKTRMKEGKVMDLSKEKAGCVNNL